jgi:hypothetical protein
MPKILHSGQCFVGSLLLIFMLMLFPAICEAEEDFIDVGGKIIRLGDLDIRVPQGWVRAPVDVEKAEQSYMLGFPGTGDFDVIVSVAFETDRFTDEPSRTRFLENIRRNLTTSGWKAGTLKLGGQSIPAYRTDQESGMGPLYLALIRRGDIYYRFYINVIKPAKDLPKAAEELLSAALSPASTPSTGPVDIAAKVQPPFPSREEVEVSNIFYGGDINTSTPGGRETANWHRTVMNAVAEACEELDRSYDALAKANANFDAAAFGLNTRLREAAPKSDWLSEDDKRLDVLARLMTVEAALDRGIVQLRSEIKAINGPLHQSRQKSHLQLLLLGLYAEVDRIQPLRAAAVYSYFTVAHHTKLSQLPQSLRNTNREHLNREADALVACLAADDAFRHAEYGVAVGITGLKEVLRVSLGRDIARMKQDLATARKAAGKWKVPLDEKDVARMMADAIFLGEEQVKDFDRAKALLDQSAPEWVGRIPATGKMSGRSGYYCGPVLTSYRVESGYHPDIIRTAAAKSGVEPSPDGEKVARDYADACRSQAKAAQTEGFFGRMFKGIQNTVGAAANTVSMGTKLAADKFYSYSYGLSEKDSRDMMRDTVKEHMAEYEQGEVGKGSMRRAIQSFESVEKGAEDGAAGTVARVVGKGWTSWAAGKLANAAVSTFTSLGKGSLQITAHDSTPGERAEGIINVATSLIGGSQHVGKPLTKAVSSTGTKVGRQAMNTVKEVIKGRVEIEAEKGIGRLFGTEGMKEASKNIGKIITRQKAALESLKKTVVDGFKSLAKGGAKALSPQNFVKGARTTLAESLAEKTLKGTGSELAKKFTAKSLIESATDNAVAGKLRRLVDGTGKEEAEKEEEIEKEETPKAASKESGRRTGGKIAMESWMSKSETEQPGTEEETSEPGTTESTDTEPGRVEETTPEEKPENEVPELETVEEEKVEEEKSASEPQTPAGEPDILKYVTPQKVVASGTVEVEAPGQDGKMEKTKVRVLITFWNVGAQGGSGYGAAVFKYRSSHIAIGSNSMDGTFTGGPNGSIKLEEADLIVNGGTSVTIPDMGTVPIQNPDAFAGWPRE